jgi:hypothetical protein
MALVELYFPTLAADLGKVGDGRVDPNINRLMDNRQRYG